MNTHRSSQQGNTRTAPVAEETGEMKELADPRSAEWRGALEYDHDHGTEVSCAKRECVAQGHSLTGAE